MPYFNSPPPPNLNYQQPNGPTPSLIPNPIEDTNKPRSITASQSKFLTALLYLQVSSQPRLHCIQIVAFSKLTTVAEPLDDQGGPEPPKILENFFFIFFFENILKICKILNNFIILTPHT